jgi:DNA-binding transcriptional regulator YiaG
MQTADLIHAVGRALFGETYQREFSRAIGINRRTLSRWTAGSAEPRPTVWAEILQLVEDRQRELARLIEAIDERVEDAK